MQCSDIRFGTYSCAYNITLPYLVKYEWEDDTRLQPMTVSIDKCLLREILNLWDKGIKTTGCCCGHGDADMAFIEVKDEFIKSMKDLGYKVYFNKCRPNDEDSFIPKTKLEYGEIPYKFIY